MLSDDLPSPQFVAPVRTAATAGKFQRVQVSVLGRYMLADRREFPCQVLEMSPGDAIAIAPAAGGVGEKVIAYLDLIGRIEGTILSQIEGGFVMDLAASPRKRDKMAAQLTWLANKDALNLPEDRRHERVVPDIRHSTVALDDGRRYNCKIIDISLSGAAVELDVRPAIGTAVTLGRMRARVARHFQNGVGVEFISAQEMLTVVQQNLRMN
ncbi:PilZ domain-containing protein [Devosia sp. J2-20]|uniref:PilZ domain-containing protein n=1 Tax=Devosia sp. J2-20 TaxID=3026161 RepID=UPI002499D40E|nr:PilZ domain-containing protein [Devosia sp. J2-20]WDQ98896.1 PilZ domain-containing protein [Devosia sp. J2-20]